MLVPLLITLNVMRHVWLSCGCVVLFPKVVKRNRYEAQSRRVACDGVRADAMQALVRVKITQVE